MPQRRVASCQRAKWFRRSPDTDAYRRGKLKTCRAVDSQSASSVLPSQSGSDSAAQYGAKMMPRPLPAASAGQIASGFAGKEQVADHEPESEAARQGISLSLGTLSASSAMAI